MRTATNFPMQSPADVTTKTNPLLREVQRALETCGYAELQQVWAHVHQSDVYLRGSVSSYYQKQVAQETVKRIPGVESLHNEITVAKKLK